METHQTEQRLGDILTTLTDYHANGDYKKLKENVELRDEPDYAVMIRTKNFEQGDFVHDLKYVNEHAYNFLAKSKVYPGDILMNKIANPGSSYLMPDLKRPVSLAMNLFLIRVDDKLADNRYVYYWLKLNETYVKSFANGTAAKTITKQAVRNLKLKLPELSYQKRVVNVLSTYQDLIENNNRRIAILEEMAQSLYHEWFVKFRFPGHEQCQMVDSPLGMIPEGWNYCSFTKVADVLSGGTPKTKEPSYWGGDISFFAPKDAPSNFYCLETEKHITDLGLNKCSSKLYSKNTVFITARGTVGKVVLPAFPMAMNQSCYALISKSDDTQRYLYLLTKSQVSYLKKNTGGATFDTIIKDTFERMMIAEPPEALKTQFEELVTPVFEQILNLSKQSGNLKKQRDLLLPKLISGQIDLSQAEQGAT